MVWTLSSQQEGSVKKDDFVIRAAVIGLVKKLREVGNGSDSIEKLLEQVESLLSATANPIPIPTCESLQEQRFLHREKDTRSGMIV